jgi:hypothetical protein
VLATGIAPANAGMYLTLIMIDPQQVEQLTRDDSSIVELFEQPKSDASLAMDKEWHAIHFLLNGDGESTHGPLGYVVFGGQPIGPDLGYGPATLLTPAQVADIASHLKLVSVDELRKRYDPAAMLNARIYPNIWKKAADEDREWILDGYRRLVDFYVRAAAQGKAVIHAVI